MNNKRKIYLTLGISVVLIAILIILFISPLFKEVKKNSEDFISKKKELSSLEFEMQNLEIMKAKYQNYKSNYELIDSLFINPEVPIDFIRFLEKLASVLKISIKISLSNNPETENQPWPSLYFQLSTTSSFLNFSKFLEKLENSSYLIEVQSLNIKKLTEEELPPKESGNDIEANILIKVFTK